MWKITTHRNSYNSTITLSDKSLKNMTIYLLYPHKRDKETQINTQLHKAITAAARTS